MASKYPNPETGLYDNDVMQYVAEDIVNNSNTRADRTGSPSLSYNDIYSDLQSGKIKIKDYDDSNTDFVVSYNITATDVPTAYKLVDNNYYPTTMMGKQRSQWAGNPNPRVDRALSAASLIQAEWPNGMNTLWEDPTLLNQFGLSEADRKQLYPAAWNYEENRNANRTASNRETNTNVLAGLATVVGAGLAGNYFGSGPLAGDASGTFAGDWGGLSGATD